MTSTVLLSPQGKLCVSVKEASELLGVSMPKMYDFVHEPDFPKIRNGNGFLIPYSQLVDWVNTPRKGGESQ